jgi:RNA polymerase sigma-70 factor (ECF subfamily)
MVEQTDASLTREQEAELVALAKSDGASFGRLYELHVRRIYNYVYYRTGNHQDAQDLTARVFFKALEHIGRYQDRGAPFSAWLYRIAHNVVANWHRSNRRSETVALEEVVGTLALGHDPHKVVEQSEAQDRLLRAIRLLPADRQQLLILKFVSRYSNYQIGDVMGRSEGAVKSLYHRTLLSLRRELSRELEEWDD